MYIRVNWYIKLSVTRVFYLHYVDLHVPGYMMIDHHINIFEVHVISEQRSIATIEH